MTYDMTNNSVPSAQEKARQKQLMQIVIGSAWVDGQIEPREAEYLAKLLDHYRLTQDKDLQRSLSTPVPIQQTEKWMRDYLFGTTEAERQRALVAIAKLMIIDETVSDTEHQLLDDYYELMAQFPPLPDIAPIVTSVGKFVKQAAEAIGRFVGEKG
jgi:uncharacterized membrane protein YebE (DUF533 family)